MYIKLYMVVYIEKGRSHLDPPRHVGRRCWPPCWRSFTLVISQDYVISNIMIKLKSRESKPGTQSNEHPRRRSHDFITVTCDR